MLCQDSTRSGTSCWFAARSLHAVAEGEGGAERHDVRRHRTPYVHGRVHRFALTGAVITFRENAPALDVTELTEHERPVLNHLRSSGWQSHRVVAAVSMKDASTLGS
jgi:hypothetical protein